MADTINRGVMPFLRRLPVTVVSQNMKLDYSLTSRLKRPVKFVHNSRHCLFHTVRVHGARSRRKATSFTSFSSSLRLMHKRLGEISR
ncbi:hypothetical protein [Comamonas terrae]|uniref:Uncharacterized protein n=1 Tax=Comamonas terrae TaxID=673548 RepID=A0ABW5UL10_9BURK|nr:hypothetical protein [Comamonas terrae]